MSETFFGPGGTNDDQGAGSNNQKLAGVGFTPFKPSAGGLFGGVGKTVGKGSDNSDVAPINKKTKYSTGSLSYPLNVEGDSQQGHYILFEILEQNKAVLKAHKIDRVAATIDMAGFGGGDSSIVGLTPEKVKDTRKKPKGNAISTMFPATNKLSTTIALYMPPSIQVQYGAIYADQEIGILAEAGKRAIEAFGGPPGTALGATMTALGEASTGFAAATFTKAADVAAPGAKAVIAIERGKIQTPRMELMFEGLGRRDFSFTFVFIPKSAREASVIEQIIYQFKFHMSSSYDGSAFGSGLGGARVMSIPSHFDIKYMYRGRPNTHLNRISTCVLKNVNVEYGGDRYVAFDEGNPQTTKMTLNFTELNIMTKEFIQQGY